MRSLSRALTLVGWLGVASAAVGQQPPASPDPLAPRAYLQLFDIDQASLATFTDGEPLDAAQREKLLGLLYRLRQYPLAAVDHYVRPADALAGISADPAAARGELFTLAGHVTHVVREPLEAAEAERFGFEAYYRCTLRLDGGNEVEVCTLAIPRAWKLDEPLDERAGARALFVKTLPPAAGAAEGTAPRLLFAAQRLAWFPDNTLGQLGMDLGLLDDVRDRAGLNEREGFYQLLAAVRPPNPPRWSAWRESRSRTSKRFGSARRTMRPSIAQRGWPRAGAGPRGAGRQ